MYQRVGGRGGRNVVLVLHQGFEDFGEEHCALLPIVLRRPPLAVIMLVGS